MSEYNKIFEILKSNKTRVFFKELYGDDSNIIENQIQRYKNIFTIFNEKFKCAEVEFFSSPGRTELGGNHTDHNHGKVLAGSINLDCLGVASKTTNNKISICDLVYNEEFIIDIEQLEKNEDEKGASALVRGIAKAFKIFGLNIGGFNLCVSSDVIPAAGISSSASFEMLICAVINSFYNDNRIDKKTYALAGQYAENNYWGKQSGLLDQMASCIGGVIAIDFEDPNNSKVTQVDFDFASKNYRLLIVNTGGNHANLSDQYSAIPYEMKAVAKYLGRNVCREITLTNVLSSVRELRKEHGDRAVLRALHFLEENKRVDRLVDAISNDDFEEFLNLISESGNSSWKWLQNCYVSENVKEQAIPLALAMTETFVRESGCKAGFRVHGGGFAGVIMAMLPSNLVEKYTNFMEGIFGEKSVYNMSLRKYGAINVSDYIK